MKCPQCNATFSELRDICPSCSIDLRPHKRAAGIPVTYPAASYEALLKKAKSEPKPRQVEHPIHKESLTGEESHQEAVQLFDNPDDPSDAVEVALQQLLQREYERQHQKNAVMEVPRHEALKPEGPAIEKDAPAPAKPLLSSSPEADLAPEIEEDLIAAALREVEEQESVETIAREDESEAPHDDAPAATISLTEVIEEPMPVPGAAIEELPAEQREEPESEETEQARPADETLNLDADEMSFLFEEASESVAATPPLIEFSVHQLSDFDSTERERALLLFDLSTDSLEHDNKDFAFLRSPAIPANSGMELMELQKAQQEIVLRTPSDPLPPLRLQQRQAVRATSILTPFRSSGLRKRPPLEPAPLGERLAAFLVDGVCMILLALAIGFFLSLLSASDFDTFMVQLLGPDPLSLVHLLRSSLVGLAAMLVLYPLAAIQLTGSTVGYSLFNIEIETEQGRTPSFAQLAVRSCCLPLVLTLVGPFPMFPGSRLLHDFAARVVVGKRD